MFRVVFRDSTALAQVANALAVFPSANWELANDGLHVSSLDGSQTSLVEVFIPANVFETYEVERPMVLGIHSPSIQSILKTAAHKKAVLCNVFKKAKRDEEGENNPDMIMIELIDERAFDNVFQLHLLNVDTETLNIPETDWHVIVSLKTSLFLSILKNQLIVSDTTRIIITSQTTEWLIDQKEPDETAVGDNLRILFVAASEKGKNMIRLTNDQAQFPTKRETYIDTEFSLKFMLQFTTCGTDSDHVELYLAPEQPLILKFGIRNGGHLQYWVAPKITDMY